MIRNRLKQLLVGFTAFSGLFAASQVARAEITLYDKDGWTVKHDGLAQGFYMYTTGDAAPKDGPAYVQFDFLDTAPLANADGSFQSSRFRSGWTGGRFNWRITNQMSENVKVSAYLGIAYSISTQGAPGKPGGPWDIRNGFLEIDAPWGDLIVGRHVGLYTLGSIISTINDTSAGLGLGNTCGVGGDGLSCYTSGYGVKFPGFWAGIVYTTPNIGGLKLKVALFDPVAVGNDRTGTSTTGTTDVAVSQSWGKTPTPNVQGLALYEVAIGNLKLNPFFNGFFQQVGRTNGTGAAGDPRVDKINNTWGAGAGIDVSVGSMFKVGVGGSHENGTALYLPLQGTGETVDGNGELRKGNSLYAHAKVILGDNDIAAGYGQATLDKTNFDTMNNLNINKIQHNIHASYVRHMGPLAFVAEINLLHHEYHSGNTQDVTFFNLGADFAY
jgi:hypothetical protein